MCGKWKEDPKSRKPLEALTAFMHPEMEAAKGPAGGEVLEQRQHQRRAPAAPRQPLVPLDSFSRELNEL